MPITLANLINRPVLLVLSSGETLRLAPGETSAELHDVEIKNNPKVDKLVAQRIVAVNTAGGEGGEAAPPAQPGGGEADSEAPGAEGPQGKPASAQARRKTGGS